MRLQAVQSNTKTALYKYVKVYWSTSKKKQQQQQQSANKQKRHIIVCVLATQQTQF